MFLVLLHTELNIILMQCPTLPVLPYIVDSTSELTNLQCRLGFHLKLPARNAFIRSRTTYLWHISPVHYHLDCGYYLVFNSINKPNPNYLRWIKAGANQLDTWNWNFSDTRTGSARRIAQKMFFTLQGYSVVNVITIRFSIIVQHTGIVQVHKVQIFNF